MKISVQVKLNAKKESIERLDDGSFVIRLRVPPVDGKANERLIELLAEHFKRPKSSVQIVAGQKSKKKTFNIS